MVEETIRSFYYFNLFALNGGENAEFEFLDLNLFELRSIAWRSLDLGLWLLLNQAAWTI